MDAKIQKNLRNLSKPEALMKKVVCNQHNRLYFPFALTAL